MKPTYIDAFVLVIAKDKVERYKKMAEDGCNVWMKFGALSYRECMGHDISGAPEEGMESLPFGKLVNLKNDETVWFSYIEYASKEHRDEVNAKVMAHWNEKFKDHPEAMNEYADVLDMKRMSTGGFSIEVSNS
jgi:uncharacterized protein YbaA (DUF1428 family)